MGYTETGRKTYRQLDLLDVFIPVNESDIRMDIFRHGALPADEKQQHFVVTATDHVHVSGPSKID